MRRRLTTDRSCRALSGALSPEGLQPHCGRPYAHPLQDSLSMTDMVLESRGRADSRAGLVIRTLSAVCMVAARRRLRHVHFHQPNTRAAGHDSRAFWDQFRVENDGAVRSTPAATVNVSSANNALTAVPFGLSPGVVNVTVKLDGHQSSAQPCYGYGGSQRRRVFGGRARAI